MSAKDAVLRAVAQVRSDKGLTGSEIGEQDLLGEEGLGLDSLDLATVVAMLEEELGIDPFTKGEVVLRTAGDLIRLYEAG